MPKVRATVEDLEPLLEKFRGTYVESFISEKIAKVKVRTEAEQQAHNTLVKKPGS